MRVQPGDTDRPVHEEFVSQVSKIPLDNLTVWVQLEDHPSTSPVTLSELHKLPEPPFPPWKALFSMSLNESLTNMISYYNEPIDSQG